MVSTTCLKTLLLGLVVQNRRVAQLARGREQGIFHSLFLASINYSLDYKKQVENSHYCSLQMTSKHHFSFSSARS